MTLEIIAIDLKDVEVINQSKADQVELVADLNVGGLTPGLSIIEEAVAISNIPVNVMLRPHADSFFYTKNEFKEILNHLKKIKELEHMPNGIVFGSLTNKGKIDEAQLQQIINHKGNLDLVFHRAFDELEDAIEGIKTLNNYSEIDVLLTSGTKMKAIDGTAVIQQLVQLSSTVKVMVGSGVNLQNIKTLRDKTGTIAFHVGTAVRENKSVYGKILPKEIDKIKAVLGT